MPTRRSILLSYSNPLPIAPSLITIIGPKIPFNKPEGMEVSSFLKAGGTVVVADDYGTGNTLLDNLNVSMRFSGKPIADLYFYSRSPSFPVISQFTSDTLTKNLTAILLDHPSYIEVADSATTKVLARSSPFSFIDQLNNGTLPPTENTTSYPIIVTGQIGKGLLVLVASSYVFTNEMINELNNRVLFSNLVEFANETATFDVVHLNRALLTAPRISFRNELDSSVTFLHSTLTQLTLAAVLVVVFSGIFVREKRVMTSDENSTPSQSTLHTNGK